MPVSTESWTTGGPLSERMPAKFRNLLDRLQPTHGTIEALVIDHIERPSEN